VLARKPSRRPLPGNHAVPPEPRSRKSGWCWSAAAMLLCLSAAVGGCAETPHADGAPAGPARAALSCGDSAGQQAGSGSSAVNGIESFALHGDTNAYDALPTWKSRNGHRYLVWKVFLAVAPEATPFRVITVASPASARLFYASPARWGAASGENAIAPPPRAVQLAACGRRFAGYTGGILITHPACVTLSITGPKIRPRTVTVPILVARCPAA
jgi:hypothetical protein